MLNMRVLACLLVLLSVEALAAPTLPPQPPEVKRTVDAVVGRWSGSMMATVPGAAPQAFDWSIDCKAAALQAGAICTMKGHASIGDLAQACLVAYDPEGKAVHYMCVTSMGEVHDHKGQWKDGTTVVFEPLVGALQGKPMTETITWAFPDPRRMTTRSVVKLDDESSMSFEFEGMRDDSKLDHPTVDHQLGP